QSSIFVSDSHDPWFNLAFEDWQTDPDRRILYLYRNSPSVIIGRNQNPWKEINLSQLRTLEIPFVRRKSGGGTVYHDLGNTNYCVFVPRTEFDRRSNAELVTTGLNSLGVPAYVNERHDICVDGFKMSPLPCAFLHVSGSAFKLVNKRAYHHGTMLIDAQLGNLRGVLGSNKDSMVTKGVASVPSPVRNLSESSGEVDHERFVEAVAEQFARKYGVSNEVQRIDEGELDTNEYVRDVVDELKSWDWQYGQTPEFTHEISGSFPFGNMVRPPPSLQSASAPSRPDRPLFPRSPAPQTLSINSRHGLISSASLSHPPRPLEWWRAATELCRLLEGDRYESVERTREAAARLRGDEGDKVRQLLEWLRGEM
ncbi:uncharacterized protein RHOBADRAFT_12541, partial [Rhodotorula graminis WP1]